MAVKKQKTTIRLRRSALTAVEDRRYEQELSALPIKAAAKEAIRMNKDISACLIVGCDIDPRTLKALRACHRRFMRQMRDLMMVPLVDSIATCEGLPKSMNVRGMSAFERASRFYGLNLSPERIRNICHERKVPRKRKTR